MKWRFWLRQTPLQSDDCASIEPLLSLYSDGIGSPGEMRRVENHLSACVDCRRALSWMQATHRVISERPAVLPPIDLRARIARAIAEAEPAPLSVRTARRPVALRPAVLAMAASLMVGVVVAEHSLMTAKHPTVPLTTIARIPTQTTRTASPVISRPPSKALPTRTDQVAVVPPHRLSPSVGEHLPTAKRRVETKIALVPDVSSRETPVAIAPVVKDHHPQPHVTPVVKQTRMATQPKTKPQGVGVKPVTVEKTTREAKNLPEKPLRQNRDDVATTSPELSTPPTAPVEVEQPKPTQVAVVVPMTPPTHEDVLSNVRARLATYRSGNPAVKVYRTSPLDSEPKFVQASINWTPTSLSVK